MGLIGADSIPDMLLVILCSPQARVAMFGGGSSDELRIGDTTYALHGAKLDQSYFNWLYAGGLSIQGVALDNCSVSSLVADFARERGLDYVVEVDSDLRIGFGVNPASLDKYSPQDLLGFYLYASSSGELAVGFDLVTMDMGDANALIEACGNLFLKPESLR